MTPETRTLKEEVYDMLVTDMDAYSRRKAECEERWKQAGIAEHRRWREIWWTILQGLALGLAFVGLIILGLVVDYGMWR